MKVHNKEDISTNRKIRHLFVRVFNSDHKTYVRLIGELGNPRIIIDEENMVLGYMKNGKYCLTNDNKEIVLEIRLLDNADDYDADDIDDIITTYKYKKIWKIRFSDSPLYLYNWNYFNSNKTAKNGYPIFSKYNPKIFYNKEYAETNAEKLSRYGYKVTVE